MFIKKRKAKNSDRIYLQDIELRETVFTPGSHYTYKVNKNKEIVIVPTEEKANKVSKRELKDGPKPVIDIRDKKSLSVFKGMKELQVEIFEDIIVVSGYKEDKVEDEKQTVVSKIKKVAKNVLSKVSNVVDITQRLDAKKKYEIFLSKKQLQQAAGQSFQQLSIFDILEAEDPSLGQLASTELKEAIDNAKIPLEVASLFSGAGISDLGVQEAGFKLVFALDHNPGAVKTYRFNLGDHIQEADFNKYDVNNIKKAPLMMISNPCTLFSNSNRSGTRLLDHPDYKLIKRTIEGIKANENCKVFCWENVPQMLTALKGAVLNEILSELSEFEISYGVLNAADFGAPQLRKRAILIGSKIGKIDLPKPELQKEEYVTVREALEGLDDSVPNQMVFTNPGKETRERMKLIPTGGNWENLPDELKTPSMLEGKTHSDVLHRLDWDKPSISIPNYRKINLMPPDPEVIRSLSVREAARLFGVKDNFIFVGKKSDMQEQICNAMCVQMAKAVWLDIKKAVQQCNIRNGFEKLSLV